MESAGKLVVRPITIGHGTNLNPGSTESNLLDRLSLSRQNELITSDSPSRTEHEAYPSSCHSWSGHHGGAHRRALCECRSSLPPARYGSTGCRRCRAKQDCGGGS